MLCRSRTARNLNDLFLESPALLFLRRTAQSQFLLAFHETRRAGFLKNGVVLHAANELCGFLVTANVAKSDGPRLAPRSCWHRARRVLSSQPGEYRQISRVPHAAAPSQTEGPKRNPASFLE